MIFAYYKKGLLMRKFFFLPLIFFIGCSTHPFKDDISMKPPKYVEEMVVKNSDKISNNPGSLFTNSDNLFSDTKAKKVNDIVTIVITENITQSSKATKKLSESNDDKGGSFDASVSGGVSIGGRNYPLRKTGLSLNLPGMSSNRNFNGSGVQNRQEKFQTTITARIVKVLRNGNYYIYGTREIYIDGQKQLIEISGVIRPEDIDSNNEIDSKYIADAKIRYITKGSIKDYTTPNWFERIWSKISPW